MIFMRKNWIVIFCCVFVLGLSGCGTSPMKYQPETDISYSQAVHVIDRLIMEQHSDWRPDFVEVTDRFILLGYGSVTQGGASGAFIGNVAIGAHSSTTRVASDRIYFESIDDIILYSWKRKFRQWYVVSLLGNNRKHILRTRSLEEAKQMANALQVILDSYENSKK
ncbi:hypothetical protein BY454_14017 [Marinobacter persicus]|uniref:Uncharacterized protein n=2 Tax=Marinobacter persicus TaxID=930118 RepID=A0A2S6G2C8_9GAMM|nr:hypothetical protein BY455_14017 [Marinobacter persicus]PPK51886.1 hypothetical protein B0H24_104017 [Marinobacter persicus]PPK56553.1 hypothetical protein BY454_14017 [Marinobacter persicus]